MAEKRTAVKIGDKFGRLTVVSEPHLAASRTGKMRLVVDVECACGTFKSAIPSNLTKGTARSCGCLRREESSDRWRTHGESKTPLYRVWYNMFIRTRGYKEADQKHYADRGIKVCKRWHSFPNFKADMGEKPSRKHSLDRKNPNLGYFPSNCRWATSLEQGNTRRNSSKIRFQGRTMSYTEWAREIGIGPKTLMYRIKNGWSLKAALSVQPCHSNKRQ